MAQSSLFERLQRWARDIKRDLVALWLAARDPRVPWYAKLLAATVTAYALSPIDLIPDFLPIIGYLDDVLLVPIGIWAAVKLVPAAIMVEHRRRAIDQAKPISKGGLVIVAALWFTAIAVTFWWVWQGKVTVR